MSYYKKIKETNIIDVFSLSIDEYIEELSYVNEDEELIKIDKNEFDAIAEELGKKHPTQVKYTYAQPQQGSIPYEDIDIKLTIMKSLIAEGILAETELMEEYFVWLKK